MKNLYISRGGEIIHPLASVSSFRASRRAERLRIEQEHRSEYFYVVAEEENEEVVSESEHVGVFQAN